MSFIPNTDADRARMLEAVGVGSVAELFHDVPQEHRFPALDLPAPLSEQEILQELDGLAARNADCGRAPCFLGAGAYHHFIPSVVDFVISRSEFATAYTPYQPEISQGTLQAIFEYQSMIARLTGMEVSNASHYDGATSTAEAVIMALNVGQHQRKRVRALRGRASPVPRGRAHLHAGHGSGVRGDEDRMRRWRSSPACATPPPRASWCRAPTSSAGSLPPQRLDGACGEGARLRRPPGGRGQSRSPSGCWCRPGSWARTWWWAKARRWATRMAFGGPVPRVLCLPQGARPPVQRTDRGRDRGPGRDAAATCSP